MIPDLGDLTDPFLCCFLLPPLTVLLRVVATAAEVAGMPLLVFPLLGKDATEEERLSSRRDSERDCVETDLAEPELRDPVPGSRERQDMVYKMKGNIKEAAKIHKVTQKIRINKRNQRQVLLLSKHPLHFSHFML